MKPHKNRRRILELRHDGQSWYLREKKLRLDTYMGLPKKDAIHWAGLHCKTLASSGLWLQLRVFNLDGRIAFERTYPRSSDPKRRAG